MLSNVAAPKYYSMFRQKVIRGEIFVNKQVEMQMNRIDELIQNPNYYYDDSIVEGFILFCENELTLTDGDDLYLLDSFKLWAEDLLGWYYYITKSVYVPDGTGGGRYVNKRIKKRLRNKQYLIVGRGAAKTLYDSCIQGYFLTVNKKASKQVTVAYTMRQAEEVIGPLKTAILRKRGPVFKVLTIGSKYNTTGDPETRQKLASTKKGIENRLNGSTLEVYPMSIDKLQGLRSSVNTIDEWLSCDVREDVVAAVEQGSSKNNDYVIVATSSEGNVRNGPGDTIKMELMRILKGEYYNPHVSIWWYKLDDVSEVSHPEMWVKANPNIGLTVSYETYQLDVERAENNPSVRNEILAKRFGLPMEGYTYFFTYEETLKSNIVSDYRQLPCALGADLSRGDDFCSFTFLFPMGNENYGIKTRNYITEQTLYKLPLALRSTYETFIDEGSLIVTNGTILDLSYVYEELYQYIIDQQLDVRCLGYDPFNAGTFVEKWERDFGPYGIEKVIQGFKTESVPLGEIKKLAEGRLLHFDQNIMQFCMGNCIVMEDTNKNRKLTKKRNDEKIDAVAALLDAFVSFKLHRDMFD